MRTPQRHHVPEWNAPETLLPRVLAAVEKPVAWPRGLQLTVAVIAAGVAAAGLWFFPAGLFGDPSASVSALLAGVPAWINPFPLIAKILQIATTAVLNSRIALFFLVATGTAMCLSWLVVLAGFRFILASETERRTA